MTRHVLKAIKYQGNDNMDGRRIWVLMDTVTGDIIGGNCPDYEKTRTQMYADCDQMWGPGTPWYGKRVHGGYSIVVG
jgi:hypothetical protein